MMGWLDMRPKRFEEDRLGGYILLMDLLTDKGVKSRS